MKTVLNGECWKQQDFPHFSGVVQWITGDEWVLLTRGTAPAIPISDPDGSGKVKYTAAEMLARLERYGWVRA